MNYSIPGREFLDKLSNAIDEVKNIQQLGYSFKTQKDYIKELHYWVKEQKWWDSLPSHFHEEYKELTKKGNVIFGLL